MSSDSQPITPARFAAALPDLSVESLHAKAAEIRNSIAHLKSSNDELREYATQGDKDCYEAMVENEEVIERMEQRIELLKAEVEGRGLRWIEHHETEGENGANGADENQDVEMADGATAGATANVTATNNGSATAPAAGLARGGRLTDEDLRRLLAERMGEDDEEGVHL